MPSNRLVLCCPLFLLPSIFLSIRVFSHELVLRIRWPKYWSFSFNISPSNEYSGLISFTIGWLDLLAVQGTLKSLLKHHSSEALILRHSPYLGQAECWYWNSRTQEFIILHAEYVMQNPRLDESQAEIKIASRNINNLPAYQADEQSE